MENTKNINLLNSIKKHLDSLEDSFYDSIPSELLKNTHLIHFSNIMEVVHSKIITLVKNNIQNKDAHKSDCNCDCDYALGCNGTCASNGACDCSCYGASNNTIKNTEININYSQLAALSKKKDIILHNNRHILN